MEADKTIAEGSSVARYMLDPSILLSEASGFFLHEPLEGHEIVASPTLLEMIIRGQERKRKYADLYGQLLDLWELPPHTLELRRSALLDYPTREIVNKVRRTSRRILSKAERGDQAILYAALKIATRQLLPQPWRREDVLYEQIALAHLLGCPALCQSTSQPAFFKILRERGAKVFEEIMDLPDDAKQFATELNDKWHEWKDEHPSVVNRIRTSQKRLGAAVEIVFVIFVPWKPFVPIVAREVFESLLAASLDPP